MFVERQYELFSPNKGLGSGADGVEGQAQEKLQTLIHAQMNESFSLFEENRLPNLNAKELHIGFILDNIGEGSATIIDLSSSFENSPLDSVSALESGDSPYGKLYFTRIALPDMSEQDKYTMFPFELLSIQLNLNRPKKEVTPPAITIEFQGTPYCYQAIDCLGNPQDKEYNQYRALYMDWELEQTKEIKQILINRIPEELTKIRATFLPFRKS